MTPLSLVIAGSVVALLIALSFFAISPVIAIPLIVVVGAVLAVPYVQRRRRDVRQVKDFRARAGVDTEEAETPRNRETIAT